MILNKKTSIYLILISILIPLITIIISGYSFSLQLTDDYVVMSPGEEYKYVIVVKNEGFPNVPSNTISVKDKLPEGLELIGVDDDIWSSGPWCNLSGIVNGSSGIKYDENTRTVSFKVSNLEAGCNISVVLKVRPLDTTTRIDMYNTAKATVNGKNVDSNIVYSYIGPESSERYKVTYNIVGLDENKTAVATPVEKEYTVGQTVGTELPSEIDGYTFSGFTSSDVTISNDKFVMPNKNVTITGTYVSSNETKHKLKFAISDSNIKDIILPKDKEFKTGETINILDIVYRYYKEYSPQYYYEYYGGVLRFGDYFLVDYNLPSNVEVDEAGYFQMPDNDTTLTLVFEKYPNIVTYRFEGDIVPKTAEMTKSTATVSEKTKQAINENILDRIEDGMNIYGYSIHNAGDTVKLKKDYKSTTCIDKSDNNKEVTCRFIGWYQNDEFVMPSYNLDVFGKWMKITGTFAPEMNLVVLNPKEKYEKGDVVEFKTTIKNTASVDIKNLVINNNFKEQTIKEGNGYKISGDQIIIDEIKANSTIEIFSNFLVGENVDRTFTNQLQLVAADAPAGYYLENDDYIVETEFDTQKVGGEEVVEPVNETEENKTIIDEQTTPKTGDEVYIYIIGAIISLLLIVGLVFVLVKNKKKSE